MLTVHEILCSLLFLGTAKLSNLSLYIFTWYHQLCVFFLFSDGLPFHIGTVSSTGTSIFEIWNQNTKSGRRAVCTQSGSFFCQCQLIYFIHRTFQDEVMLWLCCMTNLSLYNDSDLPCLCCCLFLLPPLSINDILEPCRVAIDIFPVSPYLYSLKICVPSYLVNR